MTATTSTPAAPASQAKGANGYGEFLKNVAAFGRDAALGEDALPRLAMSVTKGALDGLVHDGLVDAKGMPTNKGDATAKRHVEVIYDKYLEAKGSKAQNKEDNAASYGVQVAKLNVFVKLGKSAHVNGTELLETARDRRSTAFAKNPDGVKSAYPFMVEVARAQIKAEKEGSTDMLSDEQIDALIYRDRGDEVDKDDPATRKASALEKLQSAYKTIDKAFEDLGKPADLDKLLQAFGVVMPKLGANVPARISDAKEEKAKAKATDKASKSVAQLMGAGVTKEQILAMIAAM